MFERFPRTDTTREPSNPAIQLYGRRFYKDQTPVDYLAEFLMVFASPKGEEKTGRFSFEIEPTKEGAKYWPNDRIALKFFSFFPTSKLDSRHPQHQHFYTEAIKSLKSQILSSDEGREDAIRILQGLFLGFAGVAKARTWITYTFLPVADVLLAREITWNNPAALKNKRKVDTSQWQDLAVYFDKSTHNFLGRGGELLFLQLANIFHTNSDVSAAALLPDREYFHIRQRPLSSIRDSIEGTLKALLQSSCTSLDALSEFVEFSLEGALEIDPSPSPTKLGWIPKSTQQEALLFAFEINNIAESRLPTIEKLEMLRMLCLMQVLRSLCFQAARVAESRSAMPGFAGNYVWTCSPTEVGQTHPLKKIGQRSVAKIEDLLYRVLRSKAAEGTDGAPTEGDLKNGDDNCFRHFRKFAKDIGLVVPRTGKGQRFVLPPHLLRFLVAAVLRPGERIRLNRFFERVFAHYGIALGDRQLAVALAWDGAQGQDFAVAADTQWIEETLRQGGLLVELSDAVSIVQNPAGPSDDA